MPELNDPQKEAVAHLEGPLLVFAGAGSGKTRTITYRIAHLRANRVPPSRILAVTFTTKASRERPERVTRPTSPTALRDLQIGTCHSVSARVTARSLAPL